MTKLIEYLKTAYHIHRRHFADVSLLLTELGLSIPFQGIEFLRDVIYKLLINRYSNRNIKLRNVHPIGLLGGCSGIGKTRRLLEIVKIVETWLQENSECNWFIPIIITYNNENPPQVDLKLFGYLNGRDTASVALALRIIYFCFIFGEKFDHLGDSIVSFESFVKSFPADLMNELVPHIVMDEIIEYVADRDNKDKKKCAVYIGIDETNYLLDDSQPKPQTARAFLKETIVSLGSLILNSSAFVFSVIAGTMVQPIEYVFSDLGYPIHHLPMNLLSWEEVKAIMTELYSVGGSEQWSTCRPFCTLLADFASMPRRLENILRETHKFIESSTLQNIDYEYVYSSLLSSGTILSLPDTEVALTIISDILLQSNVYRTNVINDKLGCCLTYGDLEERGMIALQTYSDQSLTAEMPYVLFRHQIKVLSTRMKSDPLISMLIKACNLTNTNSESGELTWQLFEDLHGYLECIREMLLARKYLANEIATCSTDTFYCVNTGPDFDFKLRRECSIATISRRFPVDNEDFNNLSINDINDNPINIDETYIKNAPGALFDSFTFRTLINLYDRPNFIEEQKMLICGQQKCYMNSAVTMKMIIDEYNKAKAALPEDVPFILTIFAMKVAYDTNLQLPDNCFVVTGSDLCKFYSPVFFARVNLVASSPSIHVKINYATKWELLTIPGIENEIVTKILLSRQKLGPFADVQDLRKRVPSVHSLALNSLSFE